jgi:hypothetical protein
MKNRTVPPKDLLLQVLSGHRWEITADESRILMEDGRVHGAHQHAGDHLTVQGGANHQDRNLPISRPLRIVAICPYTRTVGHGKTDFRRSGIADGFPSHCNDGFFEVMNIPEIGFRNDRIVCVAYVVQRHWPGVRMRSTYQDVAGRHRGEARNALPDTTYRRLSNPNDIVGNEHRLGFAIR